MRRDGVELKELDDRGIAYLRHSLEGIGGYSNSLKEFCTTLDDLVSHAAGRTFSLVPSATRDDRLYDFAAGGIAPANTDFTRAIDLGDSFLMPIAGLFDEYFSGLRERLASAPHLACLAVDPMPRKGDSTLDDYGSTIFYVGDDVYHLISPDTSEGAAELALSASPFWSSLSILTHVAPRIDARRDCRLSDLLASAAAADEVSVGAYDGEGFVYWRRSA